MFNFSKIISVLSIYWMFINASPLLIDTVGNLLIPSGIGNVAENLKLCGLKTPGIAKYYGYKSDNKRVTTKDGYILTVHCIYNSTARNASLNPVIAWHGLMDASHTFVLNNPRQSLAFLLANKGYYVCLPNARGNGFSQGYINGSRNANFLVDPFWEFSWDQIAEYDVPAVIDAVLLSTGKSKVIYIGHSQGTTTMFALLSSNPSYNSKISVFIALAPVVYFKHNTSPLFRIASELDFLLDGLYGVEFLPHTYLQTLLTFLVCTLPTAALCENILFLAFGYSTHLNEKRLPVLMCKSPSNFAWGQFLHYVQLSKVDKFQKYDFESLNEEKYGQSSPPQYDLSKISAPVALFHSDSDVTTANVDVDKLKSQLSNVIFVQHLNKSVAFNHVDYIWAKDVAKIVYADVFKLIKKY